jgi:hypothetical protein
VAHALGSLARAKMIPLTGGAAGDACVLATLERHHAIKAVREKAEWALRARRFKK